MAEESKWLRRPTEGSKERPTIEHLLWGAKGGLSREGLSKEM